MADPGQHDRLQPSLLDRLTDEAPDVRRESRDRRFLDMKRLRQAVLRDLRWLLNTSHLESTEDIDAYPEVRASVLNYGMPDLTGKTSSNVDRAKLERTIRQAIWDFEPRVSRKSVRVRTIDQPDGEAHNSIAFEIEGELWGRPLPQRLYLKTEIDLEVGDVRVTDAEGGEP